MTVLAPTPPRLPRTALQPRERDPAYQKGQQALQEAARRTRTWTAYRRGKVSDEAQRRVLDRLRIDAQKEVRNLTGRLVRGELSRSAWESAMRSALVPRHYAAALAATGGTRLDATVRREVEGTIREQLGYLKRFRSEIGLKKLDGRVLVRADLYGAAIWSTGQKVARSQAERRGETEERSHLGSGDSCGSCLDRVSRGWVRIGSLLPIGAGICRSRCRCHLEFRGRDGAETRIPGRERPTRRQLESQPESTPRPVAARPVVPAAAAGPPGGTVDESFLAEVRRVQEGLTRPSQKNAAVDELIRRRLSLAGGGVDRQAHGMARAEALIEVDVLGVRFHFPPMTRPFRAEDLDYHPAVTTLRGLADKRVPAELMSATTDVYFSYQRSKDDEHWARLYNRPDLKSAATGGDGRIVVYNGAGVGVDSLAHEAAHNLATRKYGSVAPPAGSDFARINRGPEPKPTEYARVAIAEDLAETVKVYITEPDRLLRDHPERHAFARRFLEDEGVAAGSGTRTPPGGRDPSTRPLPAEAKLAVTKGRAIGGKDLDIATASERVIVEAIGGKHTGDSKPIDVEIRRKGGRIDGLEIKTVLKKSEPRLSVHADAVLRKVRYEREDPNRKVHTVVNDQRDAYEGGKYSHLYSGSTLRYRRGSGRYKIDEMHPVESFAELRRLIALPDDELPEAARGRLPSGAELAKLEADAAKDDAGRKRRDAARRERRKAEKSAAAGG